MDEQQAAQSVFTPRQRATVRLIVAPLRHHQPLRRFLIMLTALPGVTHVTPGRFHGSSVVLEVTCAGALPLAAELEARAGVSVQIESADDSALLVRLPDPSESLYDD